MPEFLITAHRGAQPPDMSWINLPDLAAARREAVRYAGELLIDTGADFEGEAWIVTVSDDNGGIVFSINVLWTAAPALDQRDDPLPVYPISP
jgi:hypothetical protein